MKTFVKEILERLRSERAQSATEYLMVGAAAVVIIVLAISSLTGMASTRPQTLNVSGTEKTIPTALTDEFKKLQNMTA